VFSLTTVTSKLGLLYLNSLFILKILFYISEFFSVFVFGSPIFFCQSSSSSGTYSDHVLFLKFCSFFESIWIWSHVSLFFSCCILKHRVYQFSESLYVPTKFQKLNITLLLHRVEHKSVQV